MYVRVQSWGESSKDWGTGIESKNFRVGSPTFFASGGAAGGSGRLLTKFRFQLCAIFRNYFAYASLILIRLIDFDATYCEVPFREVTRTL